MSVTSYSLTDIGRQRQLNQDYVFTSEVAVGPLPNLFIVADGMGGHKAGEFASKSAVETIVNEVNRSKEKNAVKVLGKAIQKANEKVRQKASMDENYQGMGTTLVLASYSGHTLCVANVGDSRLYLISDKIRQITTDHSLVEEMIRMGGLDREKARSHPDKNIITRAVGVVDEVDADFFEVDDIKTGDIVLMCSDGLSNMISDTELEEIVREETSLEDRAKKMIALANQRGGKDNITVILARLEVNEE